MDKIPFSPPKINDRVIREVTEALESGWITTGPKTKLLEKKVAALSGVQQCFCINSATAGMELLLRWWGVQEGDEVIVPAYTYCATANVVVHCGATPVMVDMRRDDFTLDVTKVEKAINEKTKAIIPVDLGGMPVDYFELMDIVETKKELFNPRTSVQEKMGRILVMTDAAHSLGARYKNRPAATWSDASVFSFHAVKNLTTAEGGAIAFNLAKYFNEEELYQYLNTKSLHGQNKDAMAKFKGTSWEYDVVEPGYKCNMPDVLAAIGLAEIDLYPTETLPKRKEIFNSYKKLLSKYNWAELPVFKTEDKESSFHLFLLRIKGISLEQRNTIINKIFNENVSVNVHYKPLPELSYYKNKGYDISKYPSSKDTWERVITLPVFYDMTEEQVIRVTEILAESVEAVLSKNND